MTQQMRIAGKTISYTVREHTRARRMTITMHADMHLTITVPAGKSMESVERFLVEKKKWIADGLALFQKRQGRRVVVGTRETYLAHKERARRVIHDRIEFFNRVYGCAIKRIAVKNHRSQWGSCSGNGNLNFNYKVVFLPEELRDYVIVHELCHLKELNHSKRFWSQVGRALPQFKELERELRQYYIA